MRRVLLAAVGILFASSAHGQMTGVPTPGYRPQAGMPASAIPSPLAAIGFDQRIDQPLPLDTIFRDEQGHQRRLGEYFGSRPVVLAFVYYQCPMLCTQVLTATASTLDVLSLDAGRDFEIVTVSIDPRETPQQGAARKSYFLDRYARPTAAAGTHFLTGDEESIRALTGAAGFRYAWDEPTQQFAHPSGVVVVTPDGRPARYLFGLDYSPRDIRLALVEASEGRVGSAVDALMLYCYHYDPMTGRYGLVIMRALRLAGVATVVAIAGFVAISLRRERRGAMARRDAGFAPETRSGPRLQAVERLGTHSAATASARAGTTGDRPGTA